jgi:hypothetical protein
MFSVCGTIEHVHIHSLISVIVKHTAVHVTLLYAITQLFTLYISC